MRRRASISGWPTDEIAQDAQAGVGGFLRMELHAEHVAALDDRRERPPCVVVAPHSAVTGAATYA